MSLVLHEGHQAGLHVLSAGEENSGPALVFLHYFGGSSRAWRPLLERLAGSHRCLAPDLPGFGRSPASDPVSLDGMVDAVARLVEARELQDYVLIGHSMGGKIALASATRPSPGLRGLVLVAPSPPGPEPMDEAKRLTSLSSHGDRERAEATLREITSLPLSVAVRAEQADDIVKVAAAAWSWWLKTGSRDDISDAVPSIKAPILVVAGEADPVITPLVVAHHVLAHLPARPSFISIARAGHLVPLEAPDALASAIMPFVAEHVGLGDGDVSKLDRRPA